MTTALRLSWCLIIAISAFAFSQNASVQAFDQSVTLDDANRAYAAGDFRGSIRCCNFVLAEGPSPMAHYCRANALVKMGQFSDAKYEYEQALESNKDEQLRRSCEAALATFKIADGSSLSHYIRANALMKIGDGDGAQEEYERALNSTSDPTLQRYCHLALAVFRTSAKAHSAGSIKVVYASAREVVDKSAVARRIVSQSDNLQWSIMMGPFDNLRSRRLDEVNSVSESLQNQLAAGSTGGIHLIEHGTDLFVRCYALDQTLNPAHAWISDRAVCEKGNFTTPLEATPESLDAVLSVGSVQNGHRSSRANVFGKLLNPPAP
jgi:tetratricopeptide (TPR) repeat protein